MGKIFNRIVRILVLDGFADTQCGFKLFNGTMGRQLFADARIDRFAYDVEILVLALRQGFRVMEIPVVWVNSPDSRVHPVKDSLRMLYDICRVRLRLGRHREPAADPGRSGLPLFRTLEPAPDNAAIKNPLDLG